MRVLIADDDVTSRLVLKATASRLGHDCLEATNGSRAWQLLSSRRIDVLLTDWMMPGVHGPDLCRRVRAELDGGYVYIVLITGLADPERVLHGMSAGADDYLIKPVHPFAVQTRLVAAERVTALHRQVADFRAQLERANLDLLGLSLTDALTGLGNRRRMEEDLARAHAHGLRSGRGFGVVLFDVDHFKLYNDHYGHLAGDDALRQVAQCLDHVTRGGERLYRYGGEEFLLLLPDRTADEIVLAAGRIHRAVGEASIVHEAQPTMSRMLTLSGGVSYWRPESRNSVAVLLSQADEALYHAKSTGRNRVHLAADHHQIQVERYSERPRPTR
jgi:diguanylate cyclase (GGDEF)-like protein